MLNSKLILGKPAIEKKREDRVITKYIMYNDLLFIKVLSFNNDNYCNYII
jgi:hypothetical protein